MKINTLPRLTLIALVTMACSISAHAQDPGDGPRGKSRGRGKRAPQGEAQSRSEGVQSSSGLQTGSLQASDSFATRMSDDEWRRRFPLAQPAKR